METKQNPVTLWLTRIVIYIVLTGFAIFMLFPFIYMVMTSLKTSNDVFHYPPRLLPYTPEMREYNGELVPVYSITVDGQQREMVLTGEKVDFGFFTTETLVNVDSPRESEILADIPLDEAVATGEVVTLTRSNGNTREFDVYEVMIDGEPQRLLLAFKGKKDVFIDPDNPEIVAYEFARTATLAEVIDFQFQNYVRVFIGDDQVQENSDNPALNTSVSLSTKLDRSLVNTTIVTLGVTVGQLVTSIFGGYAFARIPFKGRNTLFIMYLGSIMIPFVVLIIPMYRLMVAIGWQNKLVSLIVPWIFTAYGTFLMRQFFLSIPKEIEEAALLDGASRMRILWTIFVPLSKPAIATLAIFSFLYAWNSFLWPLLIIGEGNEANHVLTLSLIRLSNAAADQPNIVLTGAAIAILPPVIVFVLAQRYFIEGVATSGLKG
ncbi:MAG: carbohydrate ABC transporter permease [Chloroflexi bacterium]|nr:MAG: carbohydrate ABC transporter permease [Chloroflexota bacterium]